MFKFVFSLNKRRFYKMSKLSKPEEIDRKTIALSKTNHLILKRIMHKLECDSMDDCITKLVAKEGFIIK